MNKIDLVNNEIYILDNFNIILYLSNSYLLIKKYILNKSQFLLKLKATMNFVHFLG